MIGDAKVLQSGKTQCDRLDALLQLTPACKDQQASESFAHI